MRLRKIVMTLSAATLAAGIVLAQGPGQRPPRQPMGKRMGPMAMDGGVLSGPNVERRLTQRLGLDAEQQNKVHTALEEQQVLAKGLADRTTEFRTQLSAAVRAGDEGKIDQVTRDMAQVNQQRSAIAAKTLAKIYGTLSADQKAKIDQSLNRELGMPLERRPGPGRRAAPPKAIQQ